MFKKFVAAIPAYAMLPVRFGAGLTLVLHGWPKLADPSAWIERVQDLGLPYATALAWAAALIEVLGGILLIIGFMSRPVAFLGLFVIGTAIATVHWGQGWFVNDGGPELALLVGLMLLGVLLGGSGRASVDSIRGKV